MFDGLNILPNRSDVPPINLRCTCAALSQYAVACRDSWTCFKSVGCECVARHHDIVKCGMFNRCKLSYLTLTHPLDKPSLKKLSLKLRVLLAITPGQRSQTLRVNLDVSSMNSENGTVLLISVQEPYETELAWTHI